MEKTKTTHQAEKDLNTIEALDLFSKCSEKKRKQALRYVNLLLLMGKNKDCDFTEAERINKEMHAAIDAGPVTEARMDEYLDAIAKAVMRVLWDMDR